MSEAEPSSDSFRAWVQRVHGLHRLKRALGLAGCVAGIMLIAWGRFGGPGWALPVGLGVIGLSWVLFGWTIWARYDWVKRNPAP